MNPLTVQILVKNNESILESCLNSLSDLDCQILIGDLGCNDNTIEICKDYGADIYPLSLNNNLSKARNILIEKSSNKWNLFVEPHEILFQGSDLILNILKEKKSAYNCKIMQGDAVYRQIKLWNKDLNLKFENPVFEELKTKDFKETEVIFISGEKDNSLTFELCKKWMEDQPLNNKAIYYFACCNLFQKNWNSFLNYAALYLHNEKDDESVSSVMTKYYYAMVKSYIMKDFSTAVQKIIECISKKPLMAEFWCLLGDIYYEANEIEKAKSFYENAILLGSKRLKEDDYPIEISKYKSYPSKMIETCEKLNLSSKNYSNRPNLAH